MWHRDAALLPHQEGTQPGEMAAGASLVCWVGFQVGSGAMDVALLKLRLGCHGEQRLRNAAACALMLPTNARRAPAPSPPPLQPA